MGRQLRRRSSSSQGFVNPQADEVLTAGARALIEKTDYVGAMVLGAS
jgi:hypothetical protein